MSIKTLMGYPILHPFDPNKTPTWPIFGVRVSNKLQGLPHELLICRAFDPIQIHTRIAPLLASARARKVAREGPISGLSPERSRRSQRTEGALQKRLRQNSPAEGSERLTRGDVRGENVSRGRWNSDKARQNCRLQNPNALTKAHISRPAIVGSLGIPGASCQVERDRLEVRVERDQGPGTGQAGRGHGVRPALPTGGTVKGEAAPFAASPLAVGCRPEPRGQAWAPCGPGQRRAVWPSPRHKGQDAPCGEALPLTSNLSPLCSHL